MKPILNHNVYISLIGIWKNDGALKYFLCCSNSRLSIFYDILHWKNWVTKARNNPINIQTACIPYDRVNEFIQVEGNNVLVPTYFYQSKVENDIDMEYPGIN